ncbi:thioredoxin-like protein [Calocera cornea HHB12733]|uniref:Thioredoxin-like protein n=1 Tax=Calocera cornea HHB12733 TaxID=1353952 RepID=A0A165JK25_9BASI|nr:thioredoxin-like protein [Calocera cornea HHB12733]
MPSGLLPTPVTSSPDKPFPHPAFPFLTGRQNRSIRLLIILLASLAALAWTFQSLTHRPPVHPDSLDYAPADDALLGPNSSGTGAGPGAGAGFQSPPFVDDRLDLSQSARDIRAMLNFVTQFPERPLPPQVLEQGADVANVLRDDARSAGDMDWDEGDRELPLVVFSKTYCPFSKRAKALLAEMHLSPQPFVVEADLRTDTSLLKSLLTRLTHHSTFPNIFVGGVSLGGSDDLHLLHESGRLKDMLRAVGVKSHASHD